MPNLDLVIVGVPRTTEYWAPKLDQSTFVAYCQYWFCHSIEHRCKKLWNDFSCTATSSWLTSHLLSTPRGSFQYSSGTSCLSFFLHSCSHPSPCTASRSSNHKEDQSSWIQRFVFTRPLLPGHSARRSELDCPCQRDFGKQAKGVEELVLNGSWVIKPAAGG